MGKAFRINMTGYNEDASVEAERYQAALEMARYCDQNGFSVVSLEEHHCASNGWLASPITMASMLAATTENVAINVCALLVTLYDPIRLAEDIAVIDVVSKGRFSFVAGQGYREVEYHAMDKNFKARGKLMDEVLETLIEAWKGEPFEYKGETVQVSPKPISKPHPLMMVGGMGKNAARRAARLGLPFFPPTVMPEFEQLYYAELEKHGKTGFCASPDADASMIFVDENPDKAWDEIGPYFLREIHEYSSWKRDGVPRPFEADVSSINAVREEKKYEILTKAEVAERYQQNPNRTLAVHPMVGGVPLDRAWQCLKDFAEATQ